MTILRERLSVADQNDLRLYDSTNAGYSGWKAPSSVTGSGVYTLPAAYPGAAAFLKSDNAGQVSFDTSVYVSNTQFATASQVGIVSTAAQTFGGDKTFNNQIYKQNDATNASYVSGLGAAAAGASAADATTSTVTFAEDAIMFKVEIGTTRQTVLCSTSYTDATVSFLSDPGNVALLSDAGVGIYIFKSANSDVVSIKNRFGAARVIRVQGIACTVTSSTTWA
jgi:hypothetical protein